MTEDMSLGFRQATIPPLPGLEEYVRAVAHHCPFAELAERKGAIRYTIYDDTSLTIDEVIAITIVHMEILRREFAQAGDNSDAWLLNENLVFGSANTPAKQAELATAHWCMTVLYTGCGWVFGKFPKDLRPAHRTDLMVSSSQHDLFSIRKTIPDTDSRFYQNLGRLRDDFVNEDDGEVVVPELVGRVHFDTLSDTSNLLHIVREAIGSGTMLSIKDRVVQKAAALGIKPENRYEGELAKLVTAMLS